METCETRSMFCVEVQGLRGVAFGSETLVLAFCTLDSLTPDWVCSLNWECKDPLKSPIKATQTHS